MRRSPQSIATLLAFSILALAACEPSTQPQAPSAGALSPGPGAASIPTTVPPLQAQPVGAVPFCPATTTNLTGSAADCAKVLVPDINTVQTDVQWNIALLSEVSEDNYASRQKDSNLRAVFEKAGVDIGANFKTFAANRNSYFKKVGLSEEYKDASAYLISKVPAEARLNFVQCMQGQGAQNDGPSVLPIVITDGVIVARLHWQSPPGATTQNATFDTVGIADATKAKLPKSMLPGETKDIVLERMPGTGAIISFSIGGRSDTSCVPPPPKLNASPPPIDSRPSVEEIREYKTLGPRKVLSKMCPEGYDIIPTPVYCTSTAGPSGVANLIGRKGLSCEWQVHPPDGVGHELRAWCALSHP